MGRAWACGVQDGGSTPPAPSIPLDALLTQLGSHFIGLWCFREYGRPRRYAVTLNVNGDYYDTAPAPTPYEALRAGIRVLRRASSRQQATRSKSKTTMGLSGYVVVRKTQP